VNDNSPYVLNKLKSTFDKRNKTFKQISQPSEDPHLLVQWDCYDNIDWDRVLSGDLISNAYCTRKGLIRKAQFSYYMKKFMVKRETILSKALPDTIILDLVEDPRSALYDAYEAIDEGGLWILKPSVVDKAEIVLVVNDRKVLKKHIKLYPDIKEWVLQAYIDKPLLVDGRKFHIRSYVLLVGDLEVYLFEEMLALFAMDPYTVDNLENRFSHITNTCVQFDHENFDEDRCVKLFKEIQNDIGEENYLKILNDIKEILKDVFRAFEQEFSGFLPLPNSFELFGVDFLVDENYNTYILEFNAGPDVKNTGDRLDHIIADLIEDIVRCTIDRMICNDIENRKEPTKMIKVYEKEGKKWGMPNMILN